ncbi:ATP-binding protein [Sinorhizobium terangae]|uniref:ATP-binding protein n=1 Tax=Sinorhizobium terangae TaxID=110322 RepID=UPI003D16030D
MASRCYENFDPDHLQPFRGKWASAFEDPVVVAAISDRLLRHSTMLAIRGDRYRSREKRRSNPTKP